MKRTECIKISYTIAITMLMGLVILAVKHIYPFGANTIDYHDMGQQIAAFYYHVYDFLHGTKPIFYDYYTALGSNQAMSTSGCSNLSVFNLFFLFVKRDRLLESLSVFLLIKMVCMAMSMYVLLSLNKGIRSYAHVIMSVGYGFCGFVLTLYMTNQWMDVAFLFPLILVGLKRLVCDNRPAIYVIFLSLSLINSYYLSFMILMYVVLILGTKLISDRIFKEKDRNYHLFSLGIGTAASIGISAFILFPQLIQTLTSSRFNNESGGGILAKYISILNTIEPAYTTRWFALLGLSFSSAVIAVGLVRNRKNRKLVFNICMSCFIVALEIFLESTNLIWHFGSYVQYPIRNGFMIYVTFAMCAGYLLSDDVSSVSKTSDGTGSVTVSRPVIGGMVFILSAVICVFGICYYSNHPGMDVRKVFHMQVVVMIFTFAVYLFLILYKKGSCAHFSSILVVAEIILYGYVFIGQPTFVTGYTEGYEQNGEYIKLCNELAEAFDLAPENIYRMKNPDESLNANYGLVIRRPVLSNWTHMVSPDLQRAAQTWGYTIQYTRLLDAGGTVFSDALIGIRQIITRIPMDEKLYILKDKADIEDASGGRVTYYLYEPMYVLPWVNTVGTGSDTEYKDENTVTIHNKAFAVLGGEGDIAEYVAEYTACADKKIGLDLSGKKACYMMGECVDQEYRNTTIKVNGQDVLIPSIGEYDNTLYPAYFNCNAVYLGTFEDETAQIEILSDVSNKDEEYTIRIMTIDLDKLRGLCDSISYEEDIKTDGSSIIINKYIPDKDTDIVIPLAYDEGFEVTNNGTKTGHYRYAGLFTGIPAVTGDNEIIMTFVPRGMKAGAIVSFISIVIAVLFVKMSGTVPLIADRFSQTVFDVIYLAMMFVIYIIPVIYAMLVLVGRFIR